MKFLIEKHKNMIQELPEEETNLSDNKLSDEFDRIINGEEEREEIQDEVQEEPENDDENIDDSQISISTPQEPNKFPVFFRFVLTTKRLIYALI
jgi:hypothetical protein